MKKNVLSILVATIWISLSEFFRNEVLLKSFWTDHYQSLGLVFPSEAINGIVWGIWSLLLAVAIFMINKKFNLLQTIFLSWLMAFLMMWIVIGNLNVLPIGILLFAIPLSLLEIYLAALIVNKFSESDVKQ